MKRMILILLSVFAVCSGVFAQQSIYVSANGNDNNDGLSEVKAIKSLSFALYKAQNQSIQTITIIGTLDVESDQYKAIFHSFRRRDDGFIIGIPGVPFDITITGKPGATGADKAVLSGKGSPATVINIEESAKIRFEHIEILGEESGTWYGIIISRGGSVILGPGAVVQGNKEVGIVIYDGTCVIDGGEVRNHQKTGVLIGEKGVATMRSGSIRNNRSSDNGGGVTIQSGGRFTMSGGTISGNFAAGVGGGVFVMSGGRFDQTGGTISGNTDTNGYPNVAREEGSLGQNL